MTAFYPAQARHPIVRLRSPAGPSATRYLLPALPSATVPATAPGVALPPASLPSPDATLPPRQLLPALLYLLHHWSRPSLESGAPDRLQVLPRGNSPPFPATRADRRDKTARPPLDVVPVS